MMYRPYTINTWVREYTIVIILTAVKSYNNMYSHRKTITC